MCQLKAYVGMRQRAFQSRELVATVSPAAFCLGLPSLGYVCGVTSSCAAQVLVSIQSLIMVPQPYFNEPGYESTMHSENGRKQDREYTANIREQTMHYAIQEQLRSPPRHFEDAVRTHFR